MAAFNKKRPRILCIDLKPANDKIRADIKKAVNEVIDSDWFILGEKSKTFETEFAKYIGVSQAVGVANGLDALKIGLLVLGVKKDDKVVLPAHTFIASALAVSALNAQPVLVDIDESTGLMSGACLENLNDTSVKAVMPVHLYGNACPMSEIVKSAHRQGIKVIEDASQAHGSDYKGKMLGSWGDIGAFSLYPTKNIGALGDAGIIVTNDNVLAENASMIRNYGSKKKYHHEIKGVNSRLSEIQAAALSVKLKSFDWSIAEREKLAKLYRGRLVGVGDLFFPLPVPNSNPVSHIFVIKTHYREQLQKYLDSNAVDSQIHYPTPIHLQKAYRDLGYREGEFPYAEEFCNTCLSLPFYPGLPDSDVEFVCSLISEFFSRL